MIRHLSPNMCNWTQTYYQCGCRGPYVLKEPGCKRYPRCASYRSPDTVLPNRCYAHGHGPNLSNVPNGRPSNGGSNGSGSAGSKTGGGSQR